MTRKTAPLIHIDGLSKYFGDFQALNAVSLDINTGDIIVICGPSGSGKSTLIRCINRLEIHEHGTIQIANTEIDGSREAMNVIRQNVGMVFQQFNLFPHLTVLENLTLGPMRVRNMPKLEAVRLAMKFLERVHIPEQSEKSQQLGMFADNHPCKLPFLISCNTSVLASCLSKNTPLMALVVMIEFCFLTPLHFIQPCWASRITAHPRGPRFSTMSFATDCVIRS